MSGFSFGTPQTTTANTGFSFGASNTQPAAMAAQPAPSFGFGTPATTVNPTLGAQPTLGTLGTLGAPTATAVPAQAPAAATTGITFGSTSAPPYGTQTATSAAAPSFSFTTVTR